MSWIALLDIVTPHLSAQTDSKGQSLFFVFVIRSSNVQADTYTYGMAHENECENPFVFVSEYIFNFGEQIWNYMNRLTKARFKAPG